MEKTTITFLICSSLIYPAIVKKTLKKIKNQLVSI